MDKNGNEKKAKKGGNIALILIALAVFAFATLAWLGAFKDGFTTETMMAELAEKYRAALVMLGF